MSIEEMRHEQQLVDYKIKEITNDLGIKRFRGEEIDEEYERDCEIRIRKLKQDFNEWGSEVRKKEQAYEEEKYSAARRRMLSIPFVDEDDYIPLGDIIARYSTSKAITPDLPSEEPEDSLIMEDEHLDTIPEKESDEVIKSSVENLVPIPSESEDFSDNESECDVPDDDESLSDEDVPMENFKIYSNPLFDDEEIISTKIDPHSFNAESNLIESLLNRDTLIDSSPKFDFLFEEFSGELAHINPIPPGIEKADFDLEKEIHLVKNLLYDNSSPQQLRNEPQNESSITFSPRSDPLHHGFAGELLTLPSRNDREFGEYLSLMTVLYEISTSQSQENVHANQSSIIESLPISPIPVEDSEPAQEEIDFFLVPDDLIPPGVENDDSEDEDNELPNLDHQDDPSIPRPPPEPPDVEICLHFEPDAPVIDNFNELNEDQRGSEIIFIQNVEDDESFTFVIRTFLPFLTYPEASPLSCSTGSEDTIFDPDIITFPFSYLEPVAFSTKVSFFHICSP
ncbi:hypothetical protein Tco_0860980 [Tanacetum coccineum]|uniref:Uncharacterized protein n=1 Tax=Tanacetum coccineum TaxID=301880 RepID=A0ABQ5BK72_9ASTR